jgi:hypothetical protein
MTREQFARHLALLVRRGQITTDEARRVLAAFDAGEIPAGLIPLDATAALAPASDDGEARRSGDRRHAMWLWLILLLRLGRGTQRVNRVQARRAREMLARRFEMAVSRAAQMSARSVERWQRSIARIVSDYAVAQATAGAGRLLDDTQLARVQAANRRNLGYLALFAVHGVALATLGRPLTIAQVRARSMLYGGMGWGQFDRAAEDGVQRGWIVRYISQDDGATCSACRQYHGTVWLPSEGPYPGEVCYGGGRCRCERRLEYNPSEYARLTGRPL